MTKVNASAKLAAKGFAPKGQVEVVAEKSGTVELNAAMLKLGRQVWQWWSGKDKPYVALGIREKTALGLGTRSNMLAVAGFGYEKGKGRVLAQAVAVARGQDPNKGGIDFPWMEKQHNMTTITPGAAIRLDAKDGKLRLLPIKGTGKATPKVETPPTVKATRNPKVRDNDRQNGEVKVTRMSAEEIAALQAEADSALATA